MKLKMKTTRVFHKNLQSNKKIIVNRGGTRSSKTFSLIQLMLLKCLTEANKRIIIVRGSLVDCRKTIMKEMIDYLNTSQLYEQFTFNKSNATLLCNATLSTIEFVGADDPQKFRGLEANVWWFNEANEIEYTFFEQAIMRMTRRNEDGRNQFFLDFNPSDSFTWIKSKLEEERDDIEVIISTYLDNPFLDKDAIKEIERLKNTNPDAWLVYGEGKYGEIRGAIYRNWEMCDEFPNDCKKVAYGIDFGFSNDPSTIIKVGELHGELYVKELLYKKGMTNQDLSEYMRDLGLTLEDEIYADSAEPKSIEEIKRSGFNIKPAKKGPDSILNGIDIVKRYKLNICKPSTNLRVELINYKWKTIAGEPIKKPVDSFNHALDALRYVALIKYKLNDNYGEYYVL